MPQKRKTPVQSLVTISFTLMFYNRAINKEDTNNIEHKTAHSAYQCRWK